MESEREIFLGKINKLIIFSKIGDTKKVKSCYLQLVKEYHPDKNNKINKDILNEYMMIINNLYDETEKKSKKIILKNEENKTTYFYIIPFCRLLSKIKIIYSNKDEINLPNFTEYRNVFIEEIGKYDQNVGKSFSVLLSNEVILKKDAEIFIKGIGYYEQVFNNVNNYTEYYINKILKSANNCINEYKNKNTEDIRESAEIIAEWFNELIKKIL